MVPSAAGDACTSCLIDAALSGFRSDWPGANVRRNPDVIGAAAVAAVSEIGGAGGGWAPGGGAAGSIGAMVAVSGTLSGMVGRTAGGLAEGAASGAVRSRVATEGAGVRVDCAGRDGRPPAGRSGNA